jgi:hypothetical protein
VVAGERFARLELRHVAAAVLTAIVVAREQEGVRDMAAESARHMHEPRQANDGGARDCEPLRPDQPVGISFDDLGFAVDHEPQSTLHRNHRQWLE